MRYEVRFTNQFKKDLKLAQKQGKDTDKLFEVIEKLANIHEVQPRVSGKASGTACERTAQSVSGVNPITLTPAKPFDNSFWVCFRER